MMAPGNSFLEIKYLMGLFDLLRNVPCRVTKFEEIVGRIEQKIRSQSENEIQSDYIGSLVMDELAELDEITYVRFASVYRSFKDVGELESLLKQITKGTKKKKEK